jgi:large subunit ribosomal protein L2
VARSSGAPAAARQLLAKEGDFATIGFRRRGARVRIDCMATVGQVSNLDHENQKLGKAGRARHMGRRPTVRGSP